MSYPMHMDQIHINMLLARMAGGDIRTVIEVGCWQGGTTRQIIKRMKEGPVDRLVCIDIAPTPELQAVIKDAPGVELYAGTYPRWYMERHELRPDMVIIDADHRLPALADLAVAIGTSAKVIVLHDTRAYPDCGCGDCYGSYLAGRLLWDMRDHYRITEDAIKREGMYTERGCMMAEVRR